MDVFLTGGTGLIGSHVLEKLLAAGHTVTALVRSAESAEKIDSAGASHLMANIEDTDALTEFIAPFDATIHLASPSDETSANVDKSVATAAVTAYADTSKVYIHTGGVWVYGSGTDISEDSPFNPPAITAWRRDVEAVALSGRGMRATIIEPGIVYGAGGGLARLIADAPRSDSGAIEMIGGGAQHWTTVYVEDLAELYLLALTHGEPGYYLGVSGQNPTVREMAEAIARVAGGTEVQPTTPEQTEARLGPMAEALLLDQQATGTKAKALGWKPNGPSIIEELESGSYSATA